MLNMKTPNENRLPNFAKVALAILEAKVEAIIGKDAIHEIKNPLKRKEVEEQIVLAGERAEKQFIEKYPEDEVSAALRELPIADLPSVKLAIINFYDHPSDRRLQSELEMQIKQILPQGYSEQRILTAAKDYLQFFWKETTEIDEIREKLGLLSVIKIEENTNESATLLRAIDRKLGLLLNQERKISAGSRGSGRPYSIMANADNPALVLYLIDMGKNAMKTLNGIDVSDLISDALQNTFATMIQRSLRHGRILDRYYVGCFGYTSKVTDLIDGIKPISEIAKTGIPRLSITNENADMFEAFLHIESVLLDEIEKNYGDRPAPLICHISAGEYPCRDPEPIAKRIRDIRVTDGFVLIENVLMEDETILEPSNNSKLWSGIHKDNELAKEFPRKLFRMSSLIPESYREYANSLGFNISRGTRMLYPGTKPDIIKLGITYGAVTGITQGFNRKRQTE